MSDFPGIRKLLLKTAGIDRCIGFLIRCFFPSVGLVWYCCSSLRWEATEKHSQLCGYCYRSEYHTNRYNCSLWTPSSLAVCVTTVHLYEQWPCWCYSPTAVSAIWSAPAVDHRSVLWFLVLWTIPASKKYVNDRINVWNQRRSQFRLMGPIFTSLSTDEASVVKYLA